MRKPAMRHCLPDDICRCLDAECPDRECCLRWLDRHESNSGRMGMVTFCQSLRPEDGSQCVLGILIEKESLDEG